MKITIQNREITLKHSFRAYLVFEKLNKDAYKGESLSDILLMFYSMVISAAPGISLDFDQCVDWLDDNKSLLNDYTKWFAGEVNKDIEGADNVSKKKAKAKE